MKRSNIINSFMIGIAVVIFSIAFINAQIDRKSLYDNMGHTKAVIERFYNVGRGRYFDYNFTINNVPYTGCSTYYSNFNVGDTIIISYDKTNPENNKFLTD